MRAKIATIAASAFGIEAAVGLDGERAGCGGDGPARQARGALGVGDQLAEPHQHVLVASDGDPARCISLREGMEAQGGDVGARAWRRRAAPRARVPRRGRR